MDDEQQEILNYLTQNAVGCNMRISSSEIRDALNLESGGTTNEHIRDLIRDMVLNHECLIGSNTRGFWIINSKAELDTVITRLNSRASRIKNRAIALQKNWDNKNE